MPRHVSRVCVAFISLGSPPPVPDFFGGSLFSMRSVKGELRPLRPGSRLPVNTLYVPGHRPWLRNGLGPRSPQSVLALGRWLEHPEDTGSGREESWALWTSSKLVGSNAPGLSVAATSVSWGPAHSHRQSWWAQPAKGVPSLRLGRPRPRMGSLAAAVAYPRR